MFSPWSNDRRGSPASWKRSRFIQLGDFPSSTLYCSTRHRENRWWPFPQCTRNLDKSSVFPTGESAWIVPTFAPPWTSNICYPWNQTSPLWLSQMENRVFIGFIVFSMLMLVFFQYMPITRFNFSGCNGACIIFPSKTRDGAICGQVVRSIRPWIDTNLSRDNVSLHFVTTHTL